jgi:hypothetical protein
MLERLFKDEEMRSPRTTDKMLEPIGMARTADLEWRDRLKFVE